jgi:hypothetical protein
VRELGGTGHNLQRHGLGDRCPPVRVSTHLHAVPPHKEAEGQLRLLNHGRRNRPWAPEALHVGVLAQRERKGGAPLPRLARYSTYLVQILGGLGTAVSTCCGRVQGRPHEPPRTGPGVRCYSRRPHPPGRYSHESQHKQPKPPIQRC